MVSMMRFSETEFISVLFIFACIISSFLPLKRMNMFQVLVPEKFQNKKKKRKKKEKFTLIRCNYSLSIWLICSKLNNQNIYVVSGVAILVCREKTKRGSDKIMILSPKSWRFGKTKWWSRVVRLLLIHHRGFLFRLPIIMWNKRWWSPKKAICTAAEEIAKIIIRW